MATRKMESEGGAERLRNGVESRVVGGTNFVCRDCVLRLRRDVDYHRYFYLDLKVKVDIDEAFRGKMSGFLVVNYLGFISWRLCQFLVIGSWRFIDVVFYV
jgi:hypothetical protein